MVGLLAQPEKKTRPTIRRRGAAPIWSNWRLLANASSQVDNQPLKLKKTEKSMQFTDETTRNQHHGYSHEDSYQQRAPRHKRANTDTSPRKTQQNREIAMEMRENVRREDGLQNGLELSEE